MKATTLVKKLEKMIKKHGDKVGVVIVNQDGWRICIQSVRTAKPSYDKAFDIQDPASIEIVGYEL